jgi:transposase
VLLVFSFTFSLLPRQGSKTVVGIAVSKDSLAVCYLEQGQPQHLEVSNSKTGFQQLIRRGGQKSAYVLEATGVY